MSQEERLPLGIEDAKALLAEGRLVPPSDDITAGGYEMWSGSPPLYHDLSCMPFTKFDVKEWTGKMRKYKAEVVRYADQCRRLEKEVQLLQDEMITDTEEFEGVESKVVTALQKSQETEAILQEELARRNLNSVECSALRKVRFDVMRQEKLMQKEITETKARIGLLQSEIDHNRRRHLTSLGETTKLNLERQWLFRERLLLEETTLREIEDIGAIKDKLEKLRYAMHSTWRDTKELDLLGHARATRKHRYTDEWFAQRKRTFTRSRLTGELQEEAVA